jgi:hypothetical protein
LSTRQLYRSNNQPANYAALTQFAPEPISSPSANLGLARIQLSRTRRHSRYALRRNPLRSRPSRLVFPCDLDNFYNVAGNRFRDI